MQFASDATKVTSMLTNWSSDTTLNSSKVHVLDRLLGDFIGWNSDGAEISMQEGRSPSDAEQLAVPTFFDASSSTFSYKNSNSTSSILFQQEMQQQEEPQEQLWAQQDIAEAGSAESLDSIHDSLDTSTP